VRTVRFVEAMAMLTCSAESSRTEMAIGVEDEVEVETEAGVKPSGSGVESCTDPVTGSTISKVVDDTVRIWCSAPRVSAIAVDGVVERLTTLAGFAPVCPVV
jgi:hypothetical protein